MKSDNQVVEVLTQSITTLQEKLHTMNEVLNVLDWAIDSALEELEEREALDPQGGLLEEYRQAIALLRKHGFSKPRATGKSDKLVTCPSCQANLKGIEGKAGDRCDWCGFVFG